MEDFALTGLIVGGMSMMFLASGGVIAFFITYQKRLLNQQLKHREAEKAHQLELLNANFQSQERERNRIGRDLHDEVGALLTTAKLYFRYLDAAQSSEKFEELRDKAMDVLEETIASVRRVSHDMRPVVLERLGLVDAIVDMADKINDSGEVKIVFEHNLTQKLDFEMQLNWYRITQELINNALKHANASVITIRFNEKGDTLIMDYKDDGVGLKNNAVKSGIGLQNIESRLSLMKGKMEFPKGESKGLALSLTSKIALNKTKEND